MELVTDNYEQVSYVVFVILLAIAAIYDIWKLTIPNVVSVCLVVLFFAVAAPSPFYVPWFEHLAAGILIFIAGAVLFRFGFVGGGDVKLLAAISLWTGLDLLSQLLLIGALIGGVLAIVLLVLRSAMPWITGKALPFGKQLWPLSMIPGQGVPYGVAIAAATVLIAGDFPVFLGVVALP